MNILAIETSCDETALALVQLDTSIREFRVVDSIVYSQIKEHTPYGGVVPALAARLHNKKLVPMLQEFLESHRDHDIDAIAVTVGPGLEPSLYVGVNQARLLASILRIPIIPVNHMHGHMFSGILNEDLVGKAPEHYPFISFTISGGHTELVLVKGYNDYEIVGQTLDDAAGESFDKVARMLGLAYPGGPIVSQYAEKGGLNERYHFPRPMLKSNNGNMSFSGLKTAVLYALKDNPAQSEQDIADVCYEFQSAVIEVLVSKLAWACQEYQVRDVIIGGGVTANTRLREAFLEWGKQNHIAILIPPKALSTDNAIMIGVVAGLDIIYGINERDARVNGSLIV